VADSKAERLLQVLLCLTSTRRPLTRAQLRAAVPDYLDCPTDDAFERMFERDKAELRELGIPLRTVALDALGEEDAYTVDADSWELPAVELTRDEATAVAFAARLWHDDGTADAARRALRKLEAVGVAVDESVLPPVEPRLGGGEQAFAPLHTAVQHRQAVTFNYRRSGEIDSRPRRVEPWGLVTSRGRWYVVGFDRDRADARVFRLSRIVGKVRPVGKAGAFEVPADADVRGMVLGMGDELPTRTAMLKVRRDAGHGLRMRATEIRPVDDEFELLEIIFREPYVLAEEIVSYGASVIVESPDDVRAMVVARLRALIAEPVRG
jgi:predicted DNA-binding transcriptional regulator YafY